MNGHYLSTPLRRALEKSIRSARRIAEDGARDAIRRLGAAEPKPPTYLGDRDKDLRRRLRAHARALGDTFDKASDKQETRKLAEATAYAHWHRMLFARFLAERNLLRHPTLNAPITIEECRELAAGEGLQDAWAVAERYAAAMLPAVFRIDDPVLLVDFDPAHTQKLTALVTELDGDTFQAEDSLGWTYQFWRATEKEAVNESGVKIGADELPAVTQLFTEPYMVRFLLHNTLGAWWAGKRLAADPQLAATAKNESELRDACSLPGYGFDMLRFVREDENGSWRPAAGTFPGWPTEGRAITMLDPCCGSGHFLTEALTILATLRQQEERISPAASVAAVLRDNLHGLEIDGRCVQIAAFATALTAWRIAGWQRLPTPHIAWIGSPPPLPRGDFVSLADGDQELGQALGALHDLFKKAPLLGSLLSPIGGDLVDPLRIANVELLLEPLLELARNAEPEKLEGTIAARGMTDAVSLLRRKYTLQMTNVPFLGRAKHSPELAQFIAINFPFAKSDLATAMLKRMSTLAEAGGTLATVSPQNWFFLGGYREFRRDLLEFSSLNLLVTLGEEAWIAFGQRGPLASLVVATNAKPSGLSRHASLDVTETPEREEKIAQISHITPNLLTQDGQYQNPDSRISTQHIPKKDLLSRYADYGKGSTTGDRPRFLVKFWELPKLCERNIMWLSSPKPGHLWGGRSEVTTCELDSTSLVDQLGCRIHGQDVWGRTGVAVNKMRDLGHLIYDGEVFDDNICPIVPIDQGDLLPIAAFVFSTDYKQRVREIDRAPKVTAATLVKVPFKLKKWASASSITFPKDLPAPYSQDPTQWLFHGHPANAEAGTSLHIALARLCGYRWPAEVGNHIRLSDESRTWIEKADHLPVGDRDGILPLPSVGGVAALADRLRITLADAYGTSWSDSLERDLVNEADANIESSSSADCSIEGWLRERAFRQHCTLFNQRPFLWQIWDGLKDGFSVFVHYHRFGQATLRKLTYTVLGDWLSRAKAEKNDLRYEKAQELQQKLEKILEGEKPFDIFVRWKSLADQPLGWDPDFDDGVRLNIRPFVEASVLRSTPRIKWTKDRGSDIASAPWYDLGPKYGGKPGDRNNDHHTTLLEKRAAREAAKKAAGGES